MSTETHLNGEKPALLFLHGMFSRENDWKSSVEHFSKNWTVLAPNLPICDLPNSETCVNGLTQFVSRFLDEHGVKRAIACGNSLGGHVALLLALKNPERFPALVLAGSSGLFERSFERGVPVRPDRAWLRNKIGEVFFDSKHATEDLIEEVREMIFDSRRVRKIVRMAKSAKQNNLRDRLHQIACPVSLIWGEDDSVTPPSVAHEFNDRLPNAELHFIQRCGHAPTIEQPERFNTLLENTLAKHF